VTRLDGETRAYVRREIDRRRRIEIEATGSSLMRSNWNRARVVDSIRAFGAMEGRPPSRADFEAGTHRLPSPRTVGRIFGSISGALRAAYPHASIEVEQGTLFEAA
jgi:hypothetical protein